MKNIVCSAATKIRQIGIYVLFLFALLISLFLTYHSITGSYYSNISQDPIYHLADSLKLNLSMIAAGIFLAFVLEHLLQKTGKHQRTVGYVFLGICSLIFVAVGFIWTSHVPYYPSGDQLITTAAASYSLQGQHFMWQKGGYIGIYSQQKGLVLLYELLFGLFGDFCYHIVEKLHVISGVFTMIFGYLFLEEASSRPVYRILYCLSILFCAPYMILMPYAYGDIPSICYSVILFWAVQRFGNTSRKRYVAISCLAAILAVFCRTNSWIVLIAVGIGLFMLHWKRKASAPCLQLYAFS